MAGCPEDVLLRPNPASIVPFSMNTLLTKKITSNHKIYPGKHSAMHTRGGKSDIAGSKYCQKCYFLVLVQTN